MAPDTAAADVAIAAVDYLQAIRIGDQLAQARIVAVHGEPAVRAGLAQISLAVIDVHTDVDAYLAGLRRHAQSLREHLATPDPERTT